MGSEFEEMLKEILQEINDQGFNKDNIIDKIKDKLQEKDPRVYNGWKDNKFDIDHLFLPGIMLRMIAKDTKLTGFFIEYERTLLYVAAEHGHIQIVENLLDNGAKTGIKNGYCKEAPLHVAAKHGHTQVVEVLLKKGADVNIQDRGGRTPLHYAVQRGYPKLAKLLLNDGADPSFIHRSKAITAGVAVGILAAIVTPLALVYATALPALAIIGITVASALIVGGISYGAAYKSSEHSLNSKLSEVRCSNVDGNKQTV